ncbi:unnamed protein product [Trichobilharzia regenti]|nr:unnamed protein product [Trichobilharzia regenti]
MLLEQLFVITGSLGVAPHMLPGSPDLPNALTSGSQVSSLPTQGTLNDSSNNLQPLMQRAQAFLSSWAVSNANQRQQEANEAGPNENAVNDQRADRVEPQVAQQVIVFDNAMRNNARQDEEAEGVENMDIIDRFYMLFRLCLFVGLCFAYSSLDKAVIVFSVAAYVYIYNVYRRYAVAERLMQARRSQQNQQIDQGSSNNPVNESDSQQNQSVSEPSSSEVQTRANMPNEQEPRLTRITAHLRTAAGISYQFFSALISSIIPEQPPPLHLD